VKGVNEGEGYYGI